MCSVFVYSFFVAALSVCRGSSFAIISLGKRELGALVCSEFCVTSVIWIFLVVPWVGLSYVVVAFHGHTHLPLSFPLHHRPNIFAS